MPALSLTTKQIEELNRWIKTNNYRSGLLVEDMETFYKGIALLLHMFHQDSKALDDLNKEDARRSIRALRKAINNTPDRLKLDYRTAENGIDIDKIIPLLDEQDKKLHLRIGRIPKGLTRARIVTVVQLVWIYEKHTNKKASATQEAPFDDLVRMFFGFLDPNYIGGDQRKLIKKAIEIANRHRGS